ncbi:Beige/BEACH domain containing protein [Trichomonas vaginalis G3]|uniref:Beige/BEACH domain containing protein n=1 Tax=Trichomonas vaginalis (strain ATCC PRA-98 / G3) TaxID=412133 RepID=A2G4A4_TRIV3|nr:platelet formation protein family [Trichomonas vaginalis G3]EAX88017.1 Beige/BEACH domain containing protein [Trichomonas vaginalis G3]KAI5494776.1 platelet formation protein family [Trichomonas vaginalis G3]|eukprot:XP_001300947.1 Beige/BEACH domain containing protein [Trichomonas vaginalis G3]
MNLNIYSGRSFLVPSQYPLFPWILTDFSSPELDLNNPSVYRDLSKPVGALTKKRLDDIMKRYEEMKNIGMKPYFYGNGPVFPLSVFQYLIRMEPFTSMHIQIQGGRFDHAARLFTKISDTSRQIREQDGDFRELIPEFFFMTEFLENTNGFDPGKTDKNQLGDVILPEWCHENKFEFIYKHRKALESLFVSENINQWIDLIWGVKQKSLEDYNVYKQEMYPTYKTQSYPSKKTKDRVELRSFLDHMGQIPPQIFDNLHPKRKPLKPKPTLITQMLIKDHLDQLVSANIEIVNEECYLRFLTIQNEFCELIYDLNQLQTDGCSSPKSFTQQKISEVMLDDPLPVVFGRKLIYCAENQQNKINLTKFDNQTLSNMEIPSRISTMTLDDNYIICAGEDSKVYISKIDSKKKGAAISFSGEVTCIGFSSCFDLLVGATTDSALIFWSLSRQTNARIVELNQITVLSIIVTPSFGFVLVHARMAVGGVLKYSLILFSVNGEKIREIETKHLVCLCPWSSRDGFDYVLCADTTGNIYNFEAFWLNFPKDPIAHCGDTVLSIGMTKLAPAAISVTNAGKIFAFPVKI